MDADSSAADDSERRGWRVHVPFIGAALVCVLVFGWMLTFGTGRVFETDSLGNFYDYQAQALLHGHWDVPEPALGGEAFVVNAKYYGYFGPTPALQRMPFVAAGVAFGRMTRAMMLVDYALCLVGAYLLLRYATRRTGRAVPGPAVTVLFLMSVGLGSTLFFLGSRAYVYHEAILCGAAFGLLGTWCALEYLDRAQARWAVAGLVFGVLAVQARPPIGLFALTCVGVAAAWHLCQARRGHDVAGRNARIAGAGRALGIGLGSVLGVLSFNAVGYAKFGTFDGCPLKFHVQYTPQRLAAIDGRNFHVSNVRFNFDSYIWRSNVKLTRHFPYLTLDYLNRLKEYPESKIDYRDPTLAIPYAMPTLAVLAACAIGFGVWRGSALHGPVRLLGVSALPFAGAMLAAVATTQRYTADFCPWLIAVAACGVAALCTTRVNRATLAVISIIFLTGNIATEFAITLHTQRAVVWGVPTEVQQQYRMWQQRIDTWLGVGN